MILTGKTHVLRGKLVPVPFGPPKIILYGLARVEIGSPFKDKTEEHSEDLIFISCIIK
jgi:hypothetical protein